MKNKLLAFLVVTGLFCTRCSVRLTAVEIPQVPERDEGKIGWNTMYACENWITPEMKVPEVPSVNYGKGLVIPEIGKPPVIGVSSPNPYGEYTCMELLWDELWWPDTAEVMPKEGALKLEGFLAH